MPQYVVMLEDDRPAHQVLSERLAEIEKRERIVQITPAGTGWVVTTEKKQGRPARETRVTNPEATR